MSDAQTTGEPASAERDVSLIELASESLHAVRRYAGDVGELAALEVQLAATTAIRMAVSGVAIAVTGLAAWLLIQIAAAFWLAELGWPVAAVLAVLAVVNAVIGWLAIMYLKRLSRRLTFPATRRLLFDKAEHDESDTKHPRTAAEHRPLARRDRAA